MLRTVLSTCDTFYATILFYWNLEDFELRLERILIVASHVKNNQAYASMLARALLLPAVLIYVILIRIAPANGGIPCLFKTVFGIECWGCGITRALSALLNADFRDSFAYNPMGLPVIMSFLLISLQATCWLWNDYRGLSL